MRARWAVLSSVADQGVAALTNIAVLVMAARLSTVRDFAVFSVVYVVFTLLLGVETSYVGQALVLRRGAERMAACRGAVGFTALAATVVGGAAAAVLAFVPGEVAAGLTALGLVLPVVLVQDVLRYCFSTLQLPHYALAGDALRLAAVLPALAVQPDGSSAARLVAVWGLSALPALALAGALLARRLRGANRASAPTPVPSLGWRSYLRRDHLGRRFVVEFAVGNGSSQIAVLGLGLVASQLAVGALRGATTLFGPMNVLYNSATGFGPPLLGRVGGVRRKVRTGAVLAVVLAGVAGAWATTLALLPDRLGREILGDTWATASALLPATGTQYAAIALGTSALLTLRVLRPKATMPIQIVFSLLAVAAMLGGYALGGVKGAAWGLAAGSAMKAAALWLRITAVRREEAAREAAGASGDDADDTGPETPGAEGAVGGVSAAVSARRTGKS
ncbi:hypothetical protein [Streptomyces coryli]|uniref:hypothetical protein n=1 Tax=Streptomyces coryli TaxID=1128680 RepID=UPI001F0DC6E4|nr:hypothetical protein [Streptomyces coryli]